MRRFSCIVRPVRTRLAMFLHSMAGVFAFMVLAIASQASFGESIRFSSKQSTEQIARQALPPNSKLQHKAVNVDLGFSGKTIVVFYKTAETTTNFNGAVLIPEPGSNSFHVTRLPPMREADGLFDSEIVSVFGVGDDAGSKALVVIYRYLRLGTGDGYKHAGYVYAYDGKEWHIDDRRSRMLVSVSTAALARKRLLSHPAPR